MGSFICVTIYIKQIITRAWFIHQRISTTEQRLNRHSLRMTDVMWGRGETLTWGGRLTKMWLSQASHFLGPSLFAFVNRSNNSPQFAEL